jgi:predicted transcriptional regulator
MPKEIAIHKMVDQVFEKGVNKLVDEIAEERTFVVNTLRKWIEDDQMWEAFVTAEDKQTGRKLFIESLQELTLQELQTNALIELATIKHGVE